MVGMILAGNFDRMVLTVSDMVGWLGDREVGCRLKMKANKHLS
jgi:hypothetical protein